TVALAGGGWAWVERGRAARREAAAVALAEALSLRDRARLDPPDQLGRWAEALAAVRQPEALLAGGIEPALARQVTALRRQIEAEAKAAGSDRALLDKLISIYSAVGDDPSGSA